MRNTNPLKSGLLAVLFLFLAPYQAPAFEIERVSVSSDETEANSSSMFCNISADGKFIAFDSDAYNLVTGDSEGHGDVFVRDLVNGTTERVSVIHKSTSVGGDSYSNYPSISADGRYVAFESMATNLTAGAWWGTYTDIFVRDRVGNTTVLASVNSGVMGYGGNGHSYSPSLSADGQYVAFESKATDLGPGGGGTYSDVFVRELWAGTPATVLVSQSSPGYGGNQNSNDPSISSDGRYVAFKSQATDLSNKDYTVSGLYTDIWVWDRQDSSITLVSRGTSIGGYYGGYGGNSADPAISADGRYVAFASDASNLVSGVDSTHTDIFVRDLVNNTTSLVSVGNGGASGNGFSYYPAISPDGRYVIFDSEADDLVPGDNNNEIDVFVRDLKRKKTVLVSKSRSGEQGNLSSRAYGGGMSSDGRYVAFSSYADNLVDSDTNSAMDVFVASGFFPIALPSTLLLLGE